MRCDLFESISVSNDGTLMMYEFRPLVEIGFLAFSWCDLVSFGVGNEVVIVM